MSLYLILSGIMLIVILALIIIIALQKSKLAGYKDLEKNYSMIELLEEIMSILGQTAATDIKLTKINDALSEHFEILYSTIVVKKGDKLFVKKSNTEPVYYNEIAELGVNDLFKENIEKNVSKYITTNESGVLKYPTAPERNIKSSLMLPIYKDGDYIGFWLLEDVHTNQFDKIEKVQLSIIKDNLALILENVFYDEDLENKTRELEQANQRLEKIVNMDGLTGVFTRDFMERILDLAMDKNQTPMSIIMLDIDHFKNYNDINGLMEGDGLLKTLADVIKTELREEDMIFRYGGEEFIILLNKTNKEETKNIAEMIRRTVEAYDFPHEKNQPDGKLTISAGLAFYPEDGRNKTHLIDVADHRLSKAKEAGRNRVHFE